MRTPAGADGARASDASAAAFTRATRARYSKSTNCGRSPNCTPSTTRTSWCWWRKSSCASVKRTAAKPLREERNVIAAAQVAVAAVDDLDGHFRHVALRGVADRARELARRRIVLAAGGQPLLPLLARSPCRRERLRRTAAMCVASRRPVSSCALPTMSLVIIASTFTPRSCAALRPVRGAQQSLLLAGDGHEHQRGGKAALGERAGELHHHGGARRVVVGARRVALGVHHVAAHRVVVARTPPACAPWPAGSAPSSVATTLTSVAAFGMRGVGSCTNSSNSTLRRAPGSAAQASSVALIQRRAAPMPRCGSSADGQRMPRAEPGQRADVVSSRAGDTSRTQAPRFRGSVVGGQRRRRARAARRRSARRRRTSGIYEANGSQGTGPNGRAMRSHHDATRSALQCYPCHDSRSVIDAAPDAVAIVLLLLLAAGRARAAVDVHQGHRVRRNRGLCRRASTSIGRWPAPSPAWRSSRTASRVRASATGPGPGAGGGRRDRGDPGPAQRHGSWGNGDAIVDLAEKL